MNNEEKEYIKLTPFKMQVLQSFPFIDADFDALTNYELLCKVVDYLNKTIDNIDVLNDEVEEYINKFNELKAYVDNYFDNLDVQEEINNKLDTMAVDGTLTELIERYINPYIEAQNEEIDSFKSQINSQVNTINTKVDSIVNLNPIPVSNINQMTDITKVYVLTTDGYWYYYNGSQWTRGGVYQASVNENNVDNLINMFNYLENPFETHNLLFNQYVSSNGTITNESVATRPLKTITTDYYINIPENKIIFIQRCKTENLIDKTPWIAISLYDSDKEFISRITPNISSYNLPDGNTYLVAEVESTLTTLYYRISFRSFGEINCRIINDEISSFMGFKESDFDFNYFTQYLVEYPKTNYEFELGSINQQGNNMDSTLRIRSKDFIKVNGKYLITLKKDILKTNSYDFAVRFYNSNKVYDSTHYSGDSTWQSRFEDNYNGYIRILMRKRFNDEILENEIEEIKNYLVIKLVSNEDELTNISENITNINNNLNILNYNNGIKSINHRGYNTIAPENTLPAFKLSKKYGFNYVETDVRFTSDGIPVLLHDSTINRTARNADGTIIENSIAINSITYTQALNYDFGIYKGSEWAGTKIPTFEEFMILCKKLGLSPYIELKESLTNEQISMFSRIIKGLNMEKETTFIATGLILLQRIKNYLPNANYGFLNNISTQSLDYLVTLKSSFNQVFIDTDHYQNANTNDINILNANGITIEAWTLDSEEAILNIPNYVIGVTSNSLIASEVIGKDIIN